MADLNIMVGLPRSGKSTLTEFLTKRSKQAVVVSADTLRYLVYGQRFFGKGEPLLWAVHDIVVQMLLEQGIPIIIDETNTTVKRRRKYIELANKHGYSVVCHVVTTGEGVCLERARSENDTAIVPVIERMAKQYEQPGLEEGFSDIKFWYGEKTGEGEISWVSR